MEENRKLKQKLAEAEKENDFLKKGSSILREGNRQVIYKFIDQHQEPPLQLMRWLLKRCGVYANGYYNYLK